jgi:hypothetical protein
VLGGTGRCGDDHMGTAGLVVPAYRLHASLRGIKIRRLAALFNDDMTCYGSGFSSFGSYLEIIVDFVLHL